MPAFHIVVKVLMLRLLLANLAGLAVSGYDFGYHPSAEEFDSLLRETRGWTRDLLANEHRRSDNFVPRYRYKQEPPKSELDFQLYSDDQEQLEQQPFVYESVAPPPPEQHQQQQTMHVQGQLLQITDNLTPPAAATVATSGGGNNSGNFPIFFTNPATGIVYAISEVGRNTKSQPWPGTRNGNDSDAIAIYVTKQQYDSDLQALRQQYEQQCPIVPSTHASESQSQTQLQSPSVLSTSNVRPQAQSSSTARPQIIRLQKPKKSAMPSKLPHKPPPVMVPSGATGSISDQLLKLPTTTARPRGGPKKTQKPKRNKRKKKKKTPKRRPGHRLTTTRTTRSPSTTGPKIVMGKRTTTSRPPTPTHLATQLEKPHMPPQPTATIGGSAGSETIFNEHPFVVSNGYIEVPHHLVRRSLDTVQANPGSAGARPVSSGRRRPSSSGGKRRTSSTSRAGGRRGAGDNAIPKKTNGNVQTGESGYHVPLAVHLLHAKHNGSEEREPEKERDKERDKGRQLLKKLKARRRSAEMDFDLFELMTGSDYEDNDDDDAYYDSEREHKKSSSAVQVQSPSQENSSSAEEGADFGAMEEEPSSSTTTTTTTVAAAESSSEQEEQQDQGSSSKQSAAKKRIKRRPNGDKNQSDEYYDDDEEDEDEDDKDSDSDSDSDSFSGSFGSFFRMVFYPVQLAMTRIFDGITGTSDEQSDVEATAKPKYPTYTLYHSAHSNNALADDADEDEDEGSSLGSWFSSWFGLRRRTKKIGSTTAMPLAPVPLPTPAPQVEEPEPESVGWLESWFGFGKTTTQASSEEDDYDKWFSGWFEGTPKPKARRRQTSSTTSPTTTTPSTTSSMPQVPILTIVDPLRNPQNWIGILAHHIVNATGNAAGAAASAAAAGAAAAVSSSTSNPLLQALVTRAGGSTTTTAQPETPPHRISYDKYQIWRLRPQDEPQVRALEQFKRGEDGNKLQWLKGPSLRGLTDVLVPPKMLVDFQGTLNFEGIAHEVLIFDVGKAIAYERTKEHYLYTTPPSAKRPTKQPQMKPAMTWNKYYEHDDILHYLETMRMRHTQLIELIHIGRSYEGRPLIVVKIESKQTAAAAANAAAAASQKLKHKHKRRSGQANAVFIEAGAQGLAWIGPASATWMISELLRHMRTNKSDTEHEFIRNTTWYIMPVLNPDGYVYSHEYDRFWKKSRSQHVAKPSGGLLDSAMTWLQQKRTGGDKICYGVDLDRNWLYHWGKRGSSKAPCNEFYAGPAPFSEPETKAVSDFLMDYRTQIKLYISLQAYGQVLSYPVKANSTFNTERMDDFLDVAMVGTDKLRKKGSKTRYKVDSANDLIEQRSGCADAFAAYEIGIPFSYTLQLADNGVHGYLLPSSAIEPTARDAFEIISGMLDYI